MRPVSVITLIILGSCVAITLCLIAVWGLLFLTARDPQLGLRIGPELQALPKHIAIFIPLTLIAGMSFLSSQKESPGRWLWQAILWGALLLVGVYYVNIL